MMFLLFLVMLFIVNNCCLVSPQRGRVEVANESRRLARVAIIRIVDGGAMIGTVKALRNIVKWKPITYRSAIIIRVPIAVREKRVTIARSTEVFLHASSSCSCSNQIASLLF